MPPKPLVPFEKLDVENPVFDREVIRAVNPHRHEMELIDGILYLDDNAGLIAGWKRVRDDEFWVRGHFPDGPILPGVLMLEATAQLASFYSGKVVKHGRRMVFGAANEIRFRGMVRPGDDLIVMGEVTSMRTRATRFHGQCFVDRELVFEGEILGMLL